MVNVRAQLNHQQIFLNRFLHDKRLRTNLVKAVHPKKCDAKLALLSS
jgi:hypothetical protein